MAERRFFVLVALVFVFAAGAAYVRLHNPVPQSAQILGATGEGTPYNEVKAQLLRTLADNGPQAALDELRERSKVDASVARSCHALAHEIGNRVYEEYQDFAQAAQYQDEICNSGYLHGVIEEHFVAVPDVLAAMQEVCLPYVPGKYLSWECYHGAGHGLMFYTDNDLPKSLELCSNYTSEFARSTCVNGVFMENFNTDQKLHPSAFLKESDPFYPCRTQAAEHQSHCYLYAPTYYLSLHPGDYSGALAWCQEAFGSDAIACTRGVGSQAMKENINSPIAVEASCMEGELYQREPCIQGMVGLYINHYGALEPAHTLCGTMGDSDNKTSCEAAIAASAPLF